MAAANRTYLTFQHDAKLSRLSTIVTAAHQFDALDEANRLLFKHGDDKTYVVATKETIFHPQGGGQPSDVGRMSNSAGLNFEVFAVRMDAITDGQVLHFGRFTRIAEPSALQPAGFFKEGETIEQSIDVEKRLLYSRYHTAGHVLGAAVRSLLEKEIPGFDELKASHFPDSAGCEFQGLIEGKWKEAIQKKVDEYVAAKMPVEIDWWDEADFRKHGLERLIPERSLAPPGEKFRVVKIVGAEVYPCGGTHVETTDLCGQTTVKKITRKQGQSKVSYSVD